jgi:predicted nucleic acid-binding protein
MVMKPRVYLETTIPSYLTARPSRDLMQVAYQEATREWWESCRNDFELFVSEIVIRECRCGDANAAAKRLEVLNDISLLEETPNSLELAENLLARIPLPAKAAADSLHIAIAASHGMDYLLTWNCVHIANALLRQRIEAICKEMGCEPPIICTPSELLQRESLL